METQVMYAFTKEQLEELANIIAKDLQGTWLNSNKAIDLIRHGKQVAVPVEASAVSEAAKS